MRRSLVLFLALAALPAAADVPPVFVPQHADTVTTNSPAAPLIVPGRGAGGSGGTRAD